MFSKYFIYCQSHYLETNIKRRIKMIWFSPTTRVTVWKVKSQEKFTEVQFSSSRKEQGEGGEWKNSSWSFVRFVGKAHTKASNLQRKDRIVLTKAAMTKEPYEKDGETLYPKNPAMVVFDFDMVDVPAGNNPDVPPQVEDDSDIPF
jgi:hypothetical protein